MNDNHITDQSADRKHFTIVPRYVWAMSRNPYDFTLWCVIKDVAGENGECVLSTRQLASLAMMSTGQVADSRQYLLQAGLLAGELRKDPGHQMAVWHLTVPDLWAANVEWAGEHADIPSRVSWKRKEACSPHERLQGEKRSPHEQGVHPMNERRSFKKNQREEHSAPPQNAEDYKRRVKKALKRGIEKHAGDAVDLSKAPAHLVGILEAWLEVWTGPFARTFTKADRGKALKHAEELYRRYGEGVADIIPDAGKKHKERGLSLNGLLGLDWAIREIVSSPPEKTAKDMVQDWLE